jgi:hypothetical protein
MESSHMKTSAWIFFFGATALLVLGVALPQAASA